MLFCCALFFSFLFFSFLFFSFLQFGAILVPRARALSNLVRFMCAFCRKCILLTAKSFFIASEKRDQKNRVWSIPSNVFLRFLGYTMCRALKEIGQEKTHQPPFMSLPEGGYVPSLMIHQTLIPGSEHPKHNPSHTSMGMKPPEYTLI